MPGSNEVRIVHPRLIVDDRGRRVSYGGLERAVWGRVGTIVRSAEQSAGRTPAPAKYSGLSPSGNKSIYDFRRFAWQIAIDDWEARVQGSPQAKVHVYMIQNLCSNVKCGSCTPAYALVLVSQCLREMQPFSCRGVDARELHTSQRKKSQNLMGRGLISKEGSARKKTADRPHSDQGHLNYEL